jgi:hypothetical protein
MTEDCLILKEFHRTSKLINAREFALKLVDNEMDARTLYWVAKTLIKFENCFKLVSGDLAKKVEESIALETSAENLSRLVRTRLLIE